MVLAFVTLLLVSAAPPKVGGGTATRTTRTLAKATSVAPGPLVVPGPPATARRPHRRRRGPLRAISNGWELPARSDAYGIRARRRFASYLRLRLLEMREAGLERAAAVVERRLPVDVLVPNLRDGDVSRDAVP